MKNFLLFFCFVFSCSCFARDIEETFLQANRCYQNGEYEQALELYKSIERKGPATWSNMGNCSFKLKQYVDALVCWKRAKKNASKKELIDVNKHIAAVDAILGRAPKAHSTQQLLDRFLSTFSLFGFQFIFLCAWLFLFGLLFLLKRYRWIVFSALLPICLVFGFGTFAKYRVYRYPPALITSGSTQLFTGPDENYPAVGKVGLADEVKIVQQRQKWCKVRVNGLAGWVLADKLEVI